jgi:hypothetical protein
LYFCPFSVFDLQILLHSKKRKEMRKEKKRKINEKNKRGKKTKEN